MTAPMTETQAGRWTPGPWELFVAADACPHEVLLREQIGSVEIHHYGFSDPSIAAEQLANARLIAAAPDFAEASEPLALLVREFTGPDHEYISVTAGELRALAAALAKARGEERGNG